MCEMCAGVCDGCQEVKERSILLFCPHRGVALCPQCYQYVLILNNYYYNHLKQANNLTIKWLINNNNYLFIHY